MTQWIEPAQVWCTGGGVQTVTFHPIRDGQTIDLRNGRKLMAKEVHHEPGDRYLAYRIGRERHGLKAEYGSLPPSEIARLAKEAGTRNVALYHSSRRYTDEEFRTGLESLIAKIGVTCPVILIRGSYNLPTD